MVVVARFFAWMLVAIGHAAQGGSISFDLSHGKEGLTITNKGDSIAYYPEVFVLDIDGQWRLLAGAPPVSQIAPLKKASWRLAIERKSGDTIASLQPTMVRFFDQAGVSFGQVAFFGQPDMSGSKGLEARYGPAGLELKPPVVTEGIFATWVLAAHSDGIADVLGPGRSTHRPPLARRIDWSQESRIVSLDTGKAHPPVVLIHETGSGPVRQDVASNIESRSDQRTGWLQSSKPLLTVAQLAAGAAIALMLYGFAMRWRKGRR